MAKEKITLKNYNDIRSRLTTLIEEWNGIYNVINNPTASGYVKINKKTETTLIPQNQRDKKRISLLYSETPLEFKEEITIASAGSFDINKGYYKITVCGGGSGAHVTCYPGGTHNKGGVDCACAMTGATGDYCELLVYIPASGIIRYEVGKGGEGVKTETGINNEIRGKEQPRRKGEESEGLIQRGQPTKVWFNDTLIIEVDGGGFTGFHSKNQKSDWKGDKKLTTHAIDKIYYYPEEGTIRKYGAYIKNEIKIIKSKFGIEHTGGYTNLSEENLIKNNFRYGAGGQGKAVYIAGDSDGSIEASRADNGINGYFKIETNDELLYTEVPYQSKRIHTIGVENTIRRKLIHVLNYIWKKLTKYKSVNKVECYILGEKTNEVTTAKPYEELYTMALIYSEIGYEAGRILSVFHRTGIRTD